MIAPGGNLIAGMGGFLQMWNWRSSSPTSVYPINWNYLDVAWTRIHVFEDKAPIWGSGNFGAQRCRLLCQRWAITAKVWWDFANPPEVNLATGDTTAIKLVVCDYSRWYGGAIIRPTNFFAGRSLWNAEPYVATGSGFAPYGTSVIPQYLAPACQLTAGSPYVESLGDDGEDAIVSQEIQIDGDSVLFLIINQNDGSFYTQYVNNLQQRGLLATN